MLKQKTICSARLCLLSLLVSFTVFAQEMEDIKPATVQADSALRAAAAVKIPPGAAIVKRNAAEKGATFGVLTEEEHRLQYSDNLPISLLQRGRLNALSIRGLPVGGLEQSFAGHRLRNPFFGYRNQQLLSPHRIGSRSVSPAGTSELLEAREPTSNKPESTILFSQDYVLDLNYLDVNFAQRLSPNTYLQLAGTNFTGDGSVASGYSQFSLYTYNAQLSTRFSDNWSADFFYWQLRHRYNLEPEALTISGAGGSQVREGFKQVNHEAWMRLRGKFGSSDSLEFVPEYTTIEDRFVQTAVRRNNRYQLPGASLAYFIGNGDWMSGIKVNGSHIGLSADTNFTEANEWDGYVGFALEKKKGQAMLDIQAGLYRHSKFGNAFSGSAILKMTSASGKGFFEAEAAIRPRAAPLLWRTVDDTSTVGAYGGNDLLEQKELSATFGWKSSNVLVSITPFYQDVGYPAFFGLPSATVSSGGHDGSGVRGNLSLTWKAIHLQHNATWFSGNNSPHFAGRLDMASSVNFSLDLFGETFPLDGSASFRYIDDYRPLSFNRVLMLYHPTFEAEVSNLISSARLQSYFRDAAIFFIWENLLRDDYTFVRGVSDSFLVFKLGVDWTLFD
ncbi:MAG: hypothetical protein ACRBF0_12615 [Calditrichia bacterium]